MKKSLFLFLLIIAISPAVSGQIDSAKVKLYDSWYYFYSELNSQIKVFTYEFNDSTVTIIYRDAYFRGYVPATNDLRVIQVQDINKMLFRRKGQRLTMLLTGLFTGALIGGIIGYSNGDDPYDNAWDVGVSAETKAFAGAMIGAAIGVTIGLPIGSVKKTITIDRNVERYKQIRPGLSKYSIRYYNHKTPLILNEH